jgi:catechol 2,3-dioxygenase-like lactoylglutathione lyase family enzyme
MTLDHAHSATRLPVQDLARARQWYADKLRLSPVEERPGGLRYRLADGEFSLFESAGRSDGSFTQIAFTVDDLRALVTDLAARGVEFLDVDTAGIFTRNGIAEISGNYPSKGTGELAAWFHDCDHNLIGLGQTLHEPAALESEG